MLPQTSSSTAGQLELLTSGSTRAVALVVTHADTSKVKRREDNRRLSNGDQVSRVAALAMKRGKSVDFTGYWQRHISD